MKRNHQVISILLVVILLAISTTALAEETITGKNWMSQLPNDAPLGQVNLPGTGVSLSEFSQDKSVDEQLEMGVRLFEIDVHNSSDSWENWKLRFTELIDFDETVGELFTTINTFLDDNPSETVVVLLTPISRNSSAVNSRMLNSLKGIAAEDERDWWRFTYFEKGDTIPTVGTMRSRCVLLNVKDDSATPFRVSGDFSIFPYQAYNIEWFVHMALELQYNHIFQDYSRTTDIFKNELDTSHRISDTDYPFEYPGEPNIKLISLNCGTSGDLQKSIEEEATATTLPVLKSIPFTKGQRLGWVMVSFMDQQICEKIWKANLFSGDPSPEPIVWPESVPQPTGDWDTKNWMACLPDDAQLSQINIPGTHDTGCLYVDWGCDASARTQDMNVAEQLDAGIRVLDIRCGDLTDYFTETWEWWKLGMCHNMVDCYTGPWHTECLALEDVMEDIDNFLDAHPTETVIMETAQEGFLDSTKAEATEALKYMVAALRHDRVKQPNYYPENDKWARFMYYGYGETVPLLGNCRGKCIVISSPRVNGVKGRSYTNYEKEYDQDYVQRQDCLQFVMQDYFNPYLQDYTRRTDRFAEQDLRNVIKPGNPDVMLYGYNTNTMELAKEMKLSLAHGPEYHYLKMKDTLESFCPSVGRRVGWIGMDFPTNTMIQAIIKSNQTANASLRVRMQANISSPDYFEQVRLQYEGGHSVDLHGVKWTQEADGTYIADLPMRFTKANLDSGNISISFPSSQYALFEHTPPTYMGQNADGIYEYEVSGKIPLDTAVRLRLNVPTPTDQFDHVKLQYGDNVLYENDVYQRWYQFSDVPDQYQTPDVLLCFNKEMLEQIASGSDSNLHLSFPDSAFADVPYTCGYVGENSDIISGFTLSEYILTAEIPASAIIHLHVQIPTIPADPRLNNPWVIEAFDGVQLICEDEMIADFIQADWMEEDEDWRVSQIPIVYRKDKLPSDPSAYQLIFTDANMLQISPKIDSFEFIRDITTTGPDPVVVSEYDLKARVPVDAIMYVRLILPEPLTEEYRHIKLIDGNSGSTLMDDPKVNWIKRSGQANENTYECLIPMWLSEDDIDSYSVRLPELPRGLKLDESLVYLGEDTEIAPGYSIATYRKDITVSENDTVNVPEPVTGLIYDGTEKKGVEEGEGYVLSSNTAVNAGSYATVAMLEDGNKWSDGSLESKQIEWTVAKASPTASMFIFTAPEDLVADGKAKNASVIFDTDDGKLTGMGSVMVKYQKLSENGWGASTTEAPTEPGTYRVLADISEGDNYTSASELTSDSWKFTIIGSIYTVTVTNDGNGTAVADPESGAAGTLVKLTATPFDGYEFDRWEVISGGVTVTDDEFTLGSTDVEIKAWFKENIQPAVVLTGISITKEPDKTVYTEGEDFDSAGMIVTATYNDGSCRPVTGYEISPSDNLSTTDTTLEIRYTENGVTKTANLVIQVNPLPPMAYTVSFVMNGHGTQITAQTIKKGSMAVKPADPAESGWTFDGWYADAAFSTAFDFGTAITADTTIYAKWTEDVTPPAPAYTIIAGANGEWTKGAQTGLAFTSDAPFDKFDSVKVDGSTIAAADYTAEEGSTKITLAPSYLETLSVGSHSLAVVSTDGAASTNFTVKLAVVPPVPTTYTVVFNMNGHGAKIAAQAVKEGEKATKPADPTASGYTFGGWYADATCSTKFDFDSAITANTTVYAKWTKTSVTPTDPTTPKTGDDSNMLQWIALLFVSGGALVGTAIYGKKRKRAE